MKQVIERFKQIIRFIVTIFASREFAFLYCVLGVFAQIAHTYFLLESISSFQGGFKIFQAVLLSAFISSSLLYFVAVIDNSDSAENKRNKMAVNVFLVIEIMINVYYYSRHLIIDSPELQIFDFIFAVVISCLIPVTIKLYGSHIRAKEWMEELFQNEKLEPSDYVNGKINNTIDESFVEGFLTKYVNEYMTSVEFPTQQSGEEGFNVKELIDEKLEEIKAEMIGSLDGDIARIFEKNQALFLKQFDNKCQVLLKNQISQISTNQQNSTIPQTPNVKLITSGSEG